MYSDIVSLRRLAETNLKITRIRRVLSPNVFSSWAVPGKGEKSHNHQNRPLSLSVRLQMEIRRDVVAKSLPNHRKSDNLMKLLSLMTMLHHHGHQSAPQRFVTLQVARAIFADASQLFD